MEDKTLNSKESLELITRMITETRNNLERGGGSLFLIWGYTAIVVAVATLILPFLIDCHICSWLWWAIPIVGGVLTYLQLRNRPPMVRTYIDKFLGIIWLTIGIVAIVFPIVGMFSLVVNIMIIPVEALILSIGVVMTGFAIRYRILVIAGFISLALSLFMYFLSDGYTYVFIVMIIIGMIIPGHILNCRKRCLKS